MPKKTEKRTHWDFSTSILLQNSKKLKGDPLVGNNFLEKKSHGAENNLKREPLVSSGIVCYTGYIFGSVPWANRYKLASSQNFVELLEELFDHFRWS